MNRILLDWAVRELEESRKAADDVRPGRGGANASS
jgi:hypothetical protein